MPVPRKYNTHQREHGFYGIIVNDQINDNGAEKN
jgi:hypothetical protein